MADISKYLKAINEAVYGEQVRGSIHDAIQAVNESAEGSALSASQSADSAKLSAEKAETQAGKAEQSNVKAQAAADEAKSSEENAAESMQEAKTAKEAAASSKMAAADSAENAGDSADIAKEAKNKAKESEESALESKKAADACAQAAAVSENSASDSAQAANESAENAEKYALDAKSYAVGTNGDVRPGDATDNSKFYSDLAQSLTNEAQKLLEQAQKIIAAASTGALIPAGTVMFADLPMNPQMGYMYNISDDFVTDNRFEDGAGIPYRAGANIYWTANGTWDVLTGVQVLGVKGAAETEYHTGYVNLTSGNIGAAPTSHASAATTYGVSTAGNYGHAMASSTTPKANGTASVGTETAKFARGDHVHPLQNSVSGSSGSCTGNAASATKLATARNIQTNLASTSHASFDGTKNVTPGVTGILPLENGGTGAATAEGAREKLGVFPYFKLSGTVDLDNLKIPGVYAIGDVTLNSRKCHILHPPNISYDEIAGVTMIVLDPSQYDHTFIKQVFFTTDTPEICFRSMDGDYWGKWYKLEMTSI